MLDAPCLLRQKLIDPVREQPSCRVTHVLVPSNEAAIARAKKRPNLRIIAGPALEIQWKITVRLSDLLDTGRTGYLAATT